MRIETLTEELIPAYHAAVSAVALERRWLAIVEPFPLDEATAWARKTYLQRGFPCALALADGGDCTGWADLNPIDRPIHAHVGVLGIGVVAAHRGRGVGGRLLGAVLEGGWRFGLERVQLQVHARNTRAQKLYHRHGSVTEGVKRRHKKLDGEYDDVIEMALLFDAPV